MPKDTTAYGPRSNPSSSSFSGGGGGSAPSRAGGMNGGAGLGIQTGNTIYGNTAFGPAGGKAVGYATRTGPISGMGPSLGTFSNFRTPAGAAMVGGGLQNRPVTARNPQQALGMLQALAGTQRPSTPRVGGLLADEGVTVGEIPSIVPTAAPKIADWIPENLRFAWPGQSTLRSVYGFKNYPYPNPAMAGGWMGAQNWNNFAGTWPSKNKTVITKTPGMPPATGEESIR